MPITELADDPYVGFIASWIGEDAERVSTGTVLADTLFSTKPMETRV